MPESATTNTANAKIERKYLAHYIDSSFNGTAANYVRLGKDLEEYAIEMNPDSETKKSVGPVENRPLNENRWHYTFPHRFFPDYFQTYGMVCQKTWEQNHFLY